LHVIFRQASRFILETEDSHHHHRDQVATYVFSESADLEEFQGDVRNKDFVGRFDFESLWSRPDSGRREVLEASLQNINIWQERNYPSHQTMSYYASNLDEQHQHHVQNPLIGFQPDLKQDPQTPKTVVLEFSGRRASSSSIQMPARRRWSFRKLSSSGKLRSPIGYMV
jgi:hypothetical protein